MIRYFETDLKGLRNFIEGKSGIKLESENLLEKLSGLTGIYIFQNEPALYEWFTEEFQEQFEVSDEVIGYFDVELWINDLMVNGFLEVFKIELSDRFIYIAIELKELEGSETDD